MPKTQKKPELRMSDFGATQEFYRNSGSHYVCKCGYAMSIYGNGPEMWSHIKKCTVAQEFYDFKTWKGSQEYRKFEKWKKQQDAFGRKEMITVFIKDDEIIIMEANETGEPVDPKGLFFGHSSCRNLEDYKRHDVDTSSGVAMRIKPTSKLVATITM